jgi:antitoxin YefM
MDQAPDHLAEVVDSVQKTRERVTLTRDVGQSAAVLIAVDDLDSLLETLDILATPGALQEIREAEADIAAGRTVTLEELRAEFGRPTSAA